MKEQERDDTLNGKIEELEEFEKLVREYIAPYYIQDYLGYGRDYEFEKQIDNKVLYYLKMGLTNKDMKFKIEKRNKKLNELLAEYTLEK